MFLFVTPDVNNTKMLTWVRVPVPHYLSWSSIRSEIFVIYTYIHKYIHTYIHTFMHTYTYIHINLHIIFPYTYFN